MEARSELASGSGRRVLRWGARGWRGGGAVGSIEWPTYQGKSSTVVYNLPLNRRTALDRIGAPGGDLCPRSFAAKPRLSFGPTERIHSLARLGHAPRRARVCSGANRRDVLSFDFFRFLEEHESHVPGSKSLVRDLTRSRRALVVCACDTKGYPRNLTCDHVASESTACSSCMARTILDFRTRDHDRGLRACLCCIESPRAAAESGSRWLAPAPWPSWIQPAALSSAGQCTAAVPGPSSTVPDLAQACPTTPHLTGLFFSFASYRLVDASATAGRRRLGRVCSEPTEQLVALVGVGLLDQLVPRPAQTRGPAHQSAPPRPLSPTAPGESTPWVEPVAGARVDRRGRGRAQRRGDGRVWSGGGPGPGPGPGPHSHFARATTLGRDRRLVPHHVLVDRARLHLGHHTPRRARRARRG